MSPELTGLAIVVLVLVVLLTWWLQRARKTPQGPDVGLAVFARNEPELDEDINAPSVETIDAALQLTDPNERAAVDWLLDRRIAAKRRAS